MGVQLGSGEHTFEVNENWAKVPEEITLGDCAAVGVDRQNRVYAFNRGEHPVAVFDAEGNLLRTWGEGVFHRPHGVHVGPDDTIWLTDDGDHTVRKCTLDGKVARTRPCRRKVISTFRTATATRGSTNTHLMASS
jgi:DNA-binding beta-propeller fold protein YncE